MTRRRVTLVAALTLAATGALGAGYFGLQLFLPNSQPAARASFPTAAPSPAGPGRLVIHGTGDVNLDPRQLGLLRRGYAAPWSGVAELFRADDLTVVNLECAASELGEPVPKQFNFRCDPDALPAMREAGVDVANQGNNHAGDYGPSALVDARANLIEAGIAPVGSGASTAEANEPAIFERAGWRIAVLGFGGVVPSPDWLAGPDRPGQADGYSIESMTRAVRAADAVADLVFVTIHWGEERDTTPRADDVARARALIDAGADGIFGHHAHRLQALEWYGGRPIAYGLGNFVWPAGGPTAVAEFVVEPSGAMKACLLPGRIIGGRPVLHASSC